MINAFYKDDVAVNGIKALVRSIFFEKLAGVGFDYSDDEHYLVGKKRTIIVSTLAAVGEPSVIAELKARTARYLAGETAALHSNIREVAFIAYLKYSESPANDFEAIFNIFKQGEMLDDRHAALDALGAINDLAIIRKALKEYVLDAKVIKLQDVVNLPSSMVRTNPHRKEIRDILRKWFIANWENIHAKTSPAMGLLGNLTRVCLNRNVGDEAIAEIQAWSRGEDCKTPEQVEIRLKQITDCKRPLNQSLELVQSNTSWYNRDLAGVKAWLMANNFAV